jgi:hypothetical protein
MKRIGCVIVLAFAVLTLASCSANANGFGSIRFGSDEWLITAVQYKHTFPQLELGKDWQAVVIVLQFPDRGTHELRSVPMPSFTDLVKSSVTLSTGEKISDGIATAILVEDQQWGIAYRVPQSAKASAWNWPGIDPIRFQ